MCLNTSPLLNPTLLITQEQQEEDRMERERADASSGLVALFNRTQGVLCKVAKDHERQKSRQNQSSAMLARLRWLETELDGKWTCSKQLDKFRGHFFAFASSWTKVARADKLKGRQCILLFYLIALTRI
jgi:hypothetical protein